MSKRGKRGKRVRVGKKASFATSLHWDLAEAEKLTVLLTFLVCPDEPSGRVGGG